MTAGVLAQVPTMQQTVTPTLTIMAASLCKLAHPGLGSLGRALDKAQAQLLVQPWAYDAEAGVLAIASKHEPGAIRHASVEDCDCPTSGQAVCYHRAGALLCQTLTAAGVFPVAPLPLIDPAALDEADCWQPCDELEAVDDSEVVVRWEDQEPEEECQFFEYDEAPVVLAGPTCPQCGGAMYRTLDESYQTVDQCEICTFFLLVRR